LYFLKQDLFVQQPLFNLNKPCEADIICGLWVKK
jgi:hypothetical protein